MFISKRCSITQSNRTCAQTATILSHGGSHRKRGRCWGKGKGQKPQTSTYTETQRHTLKGYLPNLERERQGEKSQYKRESRRRDEGRERKRENTRWKMRFPCRQASDDTTHSQHSRALGIHREFWVMRSDMPQLSGPLTGCSDWPDELAGHQGCSWLAAAFLEAACEIAVYVGLSSH